MTVIGKTMKTILIIDNFDSFTYNLYQQIQYLFSGKVEVKRNNQIDVNELAAYNALVISPGPGRPVNAGISQLAVETYYKSKPILGICLGMQVINEVFDGTTVKSDYPYHGKTSRLSHQQAGLFAGIEKEITVARYHSLIIEKKSDSLLVDAKSASHVPMSIRHIHCPCFGLQFHPESFLTDKGNNLIENFLAYVE